MNGSLPFCVIHRVIPGYVLYQMNQQQRSILVYFDSNDARVVGFCLVHQHPKQ